MKLYEKAVKLKSIMLTQIAAEAREQSAAMVTSFAGILDKLQESPENPEQLAVLQVRVMLICTHTHTHTHSFI